MNKKLLHLLFALFVLLLSFNVIGGLYLYSDKLGFDRLPWQKEATVKVINSVEGYRVSFNDKAAFEGYLEKVSFWEKGVLLYGEGRRFVPDRLVIGLTDQPQENYWIVHPDNPEAPVFSLGWKAEEKKGTYTLVVHLAKEIWQNYEEKDLAREIDTNVINGILYVTKRPGEYFLGYGQDKDIEILNEVSSREDRIFRVEKNTLGWKLNLVGKVSAVWEIGPGSGCTIQSCTGSLRCGSRLVQACTCSEGGRSVETLGDRVVVVLK